MELCVLIVACLIIGAVECLLIVFAFFGGVPKMVASIHKWLEPNNSRDTEYTPKWASSQKKTLNELKTELKADLVAAQEKIRQGLAGQCEVISGSVSAAQQERQSINEQLGKLAKLIETLTGNDEIPSSFRINLGEVYKFVNGLAAEYIAAGTPQLFPDGNAQNEDWPRLLDQLKKQIEDFYIKQAELPDLNQRITDLDGDKTRLSEENSRLKDDLEAEKTRYRADMAAEKTRREEDLGKANAEIEKLNGDLAAAGSERSRLSGDYETKLSQKQADCEQQKQVLKASFAEFAPQDVLELFGVSLEDLKSAGKRVMAVYSYLSLIQELRGSSFYNRFSGFDRDLYASFDGEELREVRDRVEAHLNPKVEEEYRIEWSKPGERINPDIHVADNDTGQTIFKVKSATVYKRGTDGNWNCQYRGRVETR